MPRHYKLLLATGLLCVALGVGAAAALAAMLPSLGRDAGAGEVLSAAKQKSPARYAFARRLGASIGRTPDGRSFYVYWPGNRRGGRVIVTLHGYVATALDDFSYWQPYAAPRGQAVLALQWRLGSRASQSYQPAEIYGQLTRILRARGISPGQVMLHGYSSSAARVYGIAALDRRAARYFRLFVANAGGAYRRIPLYRQVFGGGYGRRPLRGSNWVFYCGGLDRAFSTGCPLMRRTARLVRSRGGRVYAVLADPQARHGGYLQNQQAVGDTLGGFTQLSGG